jgi:uncharacterized membrane protein YfcA
LLLDPVTLAAVAGLALLAAVVGAVGGFGTGVILTAALTPLLGIKAVVPILAVAGVIINSGRFWFYRQHVNRKVLGVSLASALPFLVLGAWIYSVLDARAVGTILGIAVIGSVPVRRFFKRRQVVLGTRGLAIGEALFGLSAGIATGTGMIQVSVLLGAGLAGPAVLATDALATIALDLCKAALFQRFDLLDADTASTGVLIGVATIPGSALGAWLVNRLGAHLHVLFMEGLILGGGTMMLWHAWR